MSIDDELTVGVVRLGSSTGTQDHDVWTLGYPKVREIEYRWAKGKVLGSVKGAGYPLIQLQSKEITFGFSVRLYWTNFDAG